jgi:hypothetical protein
MTPLETEFGSRLVTLCNGSPGLRGQLPVHITLDDADPDLLTMRASDDTIDRYGEIIDASGWRLDNYNANPVIQNSHQYGDILFTIGKATRTWVDGRSLMQVWKFASAVNPLAKIARDLYRGGFLNASSVGFLPLEWENGNEKSGFRRKFLAQELLEVSAVGIPANPNALALAAKSGAVDKSDLRELRQFLKYFCNEDASPGQPSRPSADPNSQRGQLLQLLRATACAIRHL